MVHWIEPEYSKTRVRQAGKNIRDGKEDLSDLIVIENWRACHAYVLNTFQANLRNRTRGTKIVVAQRLKRRNTIFDKLRREPHMQLPTMHDIAGCRLIFENEKELFDFRRKMHKASFKHKCKSKDDDRYNYILNPKESGYRGIHDVYEYDVNSSKGITWNGLLLEIQYRTKYQHAWATAVEVADLITTNRIKFSDADQYHKNFFKYASEIIARAYEGRTACLPNLKTKSLFTNLTK
ncbi:RelA/SpoT domain-containing protein [Magnetospirillum fulvum]|uniref:RelA/SpoT domain-containing protein n=1 Tax=Magnetospirillum fulvum TaxID=1082 RepID=UPI0018CB6C91|nr:RelA/SpoT domain-containing protein [Magnetospirillum fulvum]